MVTSSISARNETSGWVRPAGRGSAMKETKRTEGRRDQARAITACMAKESDVRGGQKSSKKEVGISSLATRANAVHSWHGGVVAAWRGSNGMAGSAH